MAGWSLRIAAGGGAGTVGDRSGDSCCQLTRVRSGKLVWHHIFTTTYYTPIFAKIQAFLAKTAFFVDIDG